METKNEYNEYEAEICEKDNKRYLVLKCKNETQIDLSSKDQSYLNSVFSQLIDEMINNPFRFEYKKNDMYKGLNDICSEYVKLLNNDLKTIYEDFYNSGINTFENKIDISTN